MDGLRAPILEDKVVDYILEIAEVEEQSVTPEELLRDPDDESEAKPAKAKAKTGAKSGAKKKAAAKPAAKDGAQDKAPAKGAAKKASKADS